MPDPDTRPARLFIGLWPPDDVRDAIRDHAQRWTWPRGAAPVRADKFHMTLHFLGFVPHERVPELVRGLHVGFEPFELTLDRGEVWSGGVAVLRPDATPLALRGLHDRLHRALDDLGLRSARQHLKPHLTVARRAQGAVPPAYGGGIRWPVDDYRLIESDLRPPTQYLVRGRYR
jgi:RNA 2',3'-cyclic 3'-phosphodiesterase